MDFASEDELQAFLAQWLEEHGHNVYREVKCPDGGAIDILTQKYAIECKRYLSRAALFAAAGQLRTYEQHFPEQQPVIAGLTPESEAADFDAVADRLKTSGVEIWFIDQMDAFTEYYRRLELLSKEPEPRRFKLPKPLAGLAVALGIAGILAGSFAIAYHILEDTETRLAMSNEEKEQWDAFHRAAEVWDINTAQSNLALLTQSNNRCVRAFATRQQERLNADNAEGFRQLNDIKRTLNDQENCKLEITPFAFSP
jgi:aryl-alcohol dehydrogenase-like predicted oxidoreductase